VFWHLPSFVFDDAFRSMLPWRAIGWALLLVVGSIFIGWLYNAARQSLFVPILFHGTQDFVMGSAAARSEAMQLIWAVLFVSMTAALVIMAGKWGERPSGPRPKRHDGIEKGS
jgi:membrane protease YdiL (CAAX protease family)